VCVPRCGADLEVYLEDVVLIVCALLLDVSADVLQVKYALRRYTLSHLHTHTHGFSLTCFFIHFLCILRD